MVDLYDIVIIGGGPAGTAAALTLRQRPDLRVLVIEKGDYSQPKIGESLSPGVSGLLTYLDIGHLVDTSSSLPQWGNCAAWGSDEMVAMDFMNTLHGTGWSLDRCRFEKGLADTLRQRGGDIAINTRVTAVDQSDQGWDLTIETDSPSETDNARHGFFSRHIKSRYIIDAGGRTSRWALQDGSVRQRTDSLTGLACWLPTRPGVNIPVLTHVEAAKDGWWYASPVPGDRIVVAFMTDSDTAHKQGLKSAAPWLEKLHRTRHIATMITHDAFTVLDKDFSGDAEPIAAPPLTVAAYSSLLVQPSCMQTSRTEAEEEAEAQTKTATDDSDHKESPIIAAGDAAVSHDPLSASGIPTALGTGIQAARVAAAYISGQTGLKKQYMDSLKTDFNRYLSTQWQIYRKETRFSDNAFWRYRQAVLTLDPQIIVTAERITKTTSLFLPGPIARFIAESARPSLPAYELVIMIQKTFPAIPAERIALGLQDMMAPHSST